MKWKELEQNPVCSMVLNRLKKNKKNPLSAGNICLIEVLQQQYGGNVVQIGICSNRRPEFLSAQNLVLEDGLHMLYFI